MYEYYFTFHSLTRAQIAEQQLKSRGLHVSIQRAPKAVAIQGCGYAIHVQTAEVYAANAALLQSGAGYERLIAFHRDGTAKEVFL